MNSIFKLIKKKIWHFLNTKFQWFLFLLLSNCCCIYFFNATNWKHFNMKCCLLTNSEMNEKNKSTLSIESSMALIFEINHIKKNSLNKLILNQWKKKRICTSNYYFLYICVYFDAVIFEINVYFKLLLALAMKACS